MDIRSNATVGKTFPKIASGESIEVVKIRIARASTQFVAVVGEFRTAEKLLSAWGNCSNDYFECDFEITFLDGFVFCGRYELWKKSKTRPSFSTFVKKSLLAAQCLDCSTSELLSTTNELDGEDGRANLSVPILSRYVIDGT
ncbi:hypothetical protein SAMN04515618_11783 [Collimonas sp. OK307]|uniref:hypothetical protein n=1 Tax=Collimonas sp. OK307 TaxID=1801620 RepID=UPI0008EF0B76|nr:hypothetical protein [Collimonas sp. OK307]SFI32657.1 hypothetical protein SAMN04515618_11783 [Collimonas sp. OK307]